MFNKMSEFDKLFSKLDGESRKVCQLKDLLAGLKVREGMGEDDKLRLARAFVSETYDLCVGMSYEITKYMDLHLKKEVTK